jgi:hypothetical protein
MQLQAEKADLAPNNPRSSHDKHPKLSILVRSPSPPEQTKIDMELELSLVHTVKVRTQEEQEQRFRLTC